MGSDWVFGVQVRLSGLDVTQLCLTTVSETIGRFPPNSFSSCEKVKDFANMGRLMTFHYEHADRICFGLHG